MRFANAVGLFLVLLAGSTAMGSPIMRPEASISRDDMPRVEVASSDQRGIGLLFDLPVLSVDDVEVDGRGFQVVGIPGGDLAGGLGQPALPVFARLIAVPDGAEVTVSCVAEAEEDLPGFDLVPMQADEGDRFVYDSAAYAHDGFSEAEYATVGSPAIFRDLRIVPVTFRPVRYNPATKTIRVASQIRVDLHFRSGAVENVKESRRTIIPPSFDRLYQEIVPNYSLDAQGATVLPGTWLVICRNDAAVTSRLQPLIDWRKRMGMSTMLATTAQTGTTNASIKAYIQNVYTTADPPLEYVVLAGDADGSYSIATWFESVSGYGGEGDHPYAQLEGTDILADIHIGRLSFQTTTELERIVSKIYNYEANPYMSDTSWFRRACLVGDPSSSGTSVIQVQQWIKTRLRQLGYTQIDTIYSGSWTSQMTTALNRGDTVFSYRGFYGMSGWTNSNTYLLTNGWMMPFVVTITCDTGSFYDDNACRSEGFLRAWDSTNNRPRGAVGAIGTATTGTHTRYNNCIHTGIFYGLLYTGDYHLGAALTFGKLELYRNYQVNEPNRVIMFSHWHNLMGDPATDCWTGIPTALSVTHPSSVPLGTNAVSVTVQDQGQACADALVCLWKGTETYAVGYTDASGYVELPVATPTTGDMLVTVTKHDRYPYTGTIPVNTSTRYVGYQAATIDDDSSGGSSGNGDGIVNPGETVELRVQLKNFGSQTATGVTAVLTSLDPYVTISDANETFGDIAGGATAWSAEDFDLSIDHACPHGRAIRLGLDISSGINQWHSLIDLEVVSGDLSASGAYTLYNAGGNGLLDPGETVGLSVLLSNKGGVPAVTPTASLLSLSQYTNVVDGIGAYTTINPGGQAENTVDRFSISAAPNTPEGYLATFKLLLDFSGGARDTTFVAVPVGTRSTDDPCGPDGYGYYAYDNTDVGYPEVPTYSWIEIDPTYGGSGTEVVLGDNGAGQDKSRVVDIPFSFKYYGTNYTRATICSNGWLAMGSQWNTEFRNWTIPSAGGPQAMIAPFWDDLYQYGGGKVFQRYDSTNHWWIVEWSRMRNTYNSSTVIFEVILKDPAFHPTETGDGEIVFQYHTISNPDADDNYSTVGIENQMHTDGVLYSYYNRYAGGAATLAANRAIRFVPKHEVLAGQVFGTVRNLSAGMLPLVGAQVSVLENGHIYMTDTTGAYSAEELAGTYNLRAAHTGFAPDTVEAVQVLIGGSVQVDFALRDIAPPSITSVPLESTVDTIGPYNVDAGVADSSFISEARVYFSLDNTPLQFVNMTFQGAGIYRGKIPGQPWGTKISYFIHVRDSGGNLATDPADAPDNMYTFWVVAPTIVFSENFETDRGVWAVGGPSDTATEGAWVRVDPNATYHDTTMVQTEHDHTRAPGSHCMVTGNAPPGGREWDQDVDGGRTTLTSAILFPPLQGVVTLSYYRWYTNNTGPYGGEDEWVVQVSDDNGQTWVDLERTTTSARYWKRMQFSLGEYIDTQGWVRIRFVAEDRLNPSIVEAAVDDIEVILNGEISLTGVDTEVALDFGLSQNEPNPFRGTTQMRYVVREPGMARLVVYDVQGRAVRTLVEGPAQSGILAVTWDGRDDSGHPVPSGIYICRYASGGRFESRKMILLE